MEDNNYEKKVISLLFISIIWMYFPLSGVYALTNKPLQGSQEQIHHDILCSLLMPYIDKSVDDYYTKFLNYPVRVDPWDVEILSEEQPNTNFRFVIKMKVFPYVGPHISVGEDNITMSVEVPDVVVNNFEHIKSDYLNLPYNWQPIIKPK